MPRPLSLRLRPESLAIVRLGADAGLPWWAVRTDGFLSFTRTGEETSIVCDASAVPLGVAAEKPYRTFRVVGTLAFTEIGIMASLANPLAEAGVSIFVVSTHDTDYILVPERQLSTAIEALRKAGHSVS